MGIQEDLNSFIHKHKIEKGKPYSNTSLGNTKASFFISDDEYEQFLNLYSLALTNGISLHYTEKPIDPSPLRVDLDFRFPVEETNKYDENGNLKRIYTEEHVDKIVKHYLQTINMYIQVDDDKNLAYVMEKPKPSLNRNKIKDGIHIVFPHIIVSNNVQHFIRKKILDIAADVFANLPICNEYESIIDKAIIDSNCWLMYGSKKMEADAYRVSKIYQYKEGNIELLSEPISATDEISFIKLFSMRKKGTQTPVLPQYVSEIEEYIKHVLPAIDLKYKTKLHNNIFAKSLNINKNYTTDDDLVIIKRLVLECLSNTRAEKYDDWINLGWVLRNIDYRLLDTWVEFSKIGSSYVEGECQKLWNKMRKDHMGIGTLKWWAKQDNIMKYDEIINDSIIPLVDKCIRSEGAHYDIAKVVQAIYKNEIKTVNRTIWYKYDKDKHRWKITTEGSALRIILSEDICGKFIQRAHHWNCQASNTHDDNEKDVFSDRSKHCMTIAKQLKNSSFKTNIMKELQCLFMDEKFDELLDSRSHLIGFANGVYDLKMHIFRDGMPDDYIFHSTKVNYIAYNPELPEYGEIHDFFNKLFTVESVKNYVLDVLACTIDGSIAQERFYIFTGQGSNGKSRLLDLVQKAIGDYYCILPIALLTQKRVASNSAQSELERTKGRRFAVMQEPSNDDKINIGFMKELSGNDNIITRGLYKEPTEFKPQFKMILTCNELPEVPSDDGGTWRRIRVIEFKSKFCENPTKPNEFPMDLELSDKFERWTEAFMSMLIERHKHINPNAIPEPMEVRIATESYKNNNDIIGQFINDRIVIDKNAVESRLGIQSIYNEFRVWSMENVPKNKKRPDRNQIRAYLEKMLGAYPIDNKGWKGISYKPMADDAE
jgi:P4 family phage/plasmid primase-like protien